ncbi:MAG: DUF4382 domain-containing protein [Bacteroidetes bacterium]|nr:DUF4382 domain-containing protein [Bacteroidota bacterium]
MQLSRVLIILFFFAVLSSCEETTGNDTSKVSVGITDAPASVDSIMISFNKIEAKVDSNWLTLFEGSSTFDLLKFTNGKFNLLTQNLDLEGDHIHFLRIKMTGATVYKDGVAHAMTVPGGDTRGIQINVKNGLLKAGISYTLLVDVDARRTFIRTKNGFRMKPVLRAFLIAQTGKINGTLQGWTDDPTVFAMSGSDTVATAQPDPSGAFTLWYLDPGSYSIAVSDTVGFSKAYAGPYTVTAGGTTSAGTLPKSDPK